MIQNADGSSITSHQNDLKISLNVQVFIRCLKYYNIHMIQIFIRLVNRHIN